MTQYSSIFLYMSQRCYLKWFVKFIIAYLVNYNRLRLDHSQRSERQGSALQESCIIVSVSIKDFENECTSSNVNFTSNDLFVASVMRNISLQCSKKQQWWCHGNIIAGYSIWLLKTHPMYVYVTKHTDPIKILMFTTIIIIICIGLIVKQFNFLWILIFFVLFSKTVSSHIIYLPMFMILQDYSRLASSQWETALLCNDVSHLLGASLECATTHMLMITWMVG